MLIIQPDQPVYWDYDPESHEALLDMVSSYLETADMTDAEATRVSLDKDKLTITLTGQFTTRIEVTTGDAHWLITLQTDDFTWSETISLSLLQELEQDGKIIVHQWITDQLATFTTKAVSQAVKKANRKFATRQPKPMASRYGDWLGSPEPKGSSFDNNLVPQYGGRPL